MNRREFIQGVTLALTALGIREQSKPQIEELSKVMATPDGLEVIRNVQPNDADYLAIALWWWKDNKLIGTRTVKFTYRTLKYRDQLKKLVHDRIEAESIAFTEEMQTYLKTGGQA